MGRALASLDVWVTSGKGRNSALRAIVLAAWQRVAELLANGEQLAEIGIAEISSRAAVDARGPIAAGAKPATTENVVVHARTERAPALPRRDVKRLLVPPPT